MTTHEGTVVAVTIEVDTAALAGYTDRHLAMLWHVAQANPANGFADAGPGDLAEQVGREIIRRWLASTRPELWHHQGRTTTGTSCAGSPSTSPVKRPGSPARPAAAATRRVGGVMVASAEQGQRPPADGQSGSRQRLYELVCGGVGTVGELGDRSGYADTFVRVILQALADAGLVRRAGGRWMAAAAGSTAGGSA